MNDAKKTKAELIRELEDLRRQARTPDAGPSGEDAAGIIPGVASLVGYITAFDATPLPATLIDAEGIVVDVNQAFLDIAHGYGYEITKEDRIGGHIASFAMLEEERIRIKNFIDELLCTGETRHLEWGGRDKAGQQHLWDIHASVLKDEERQVMGALILREDITTQKQTERLLNAYHQIGQAILSTMDLDEILKTLAEQILTAGIFRTLAISLVNEEHQYVEHALSAFMGGNGFEWDIPDPLPRYPLDDRDILAETARTGEMQVAVGWDDRFTIRPGKKERILKRIAPFFSFRSSTRIVS